MGTKEYDDQARKDIELPMKYYTSYLNWERQGRFFVLTGAGGVSNVSMRKQNWVGVRDDGEESVSLYVPADMDGGALCEGSAVCRVDKC